MALSAPAKTLVAAFSGGNVTMGDVKKRGAEIKRDHALALELWGPLSFSHGCWRL